jgi:hypothetical protein
MSTSIFIQLSGSLLAKFVFVNGPLSTRWDVFGCFVDDTSSADDMDVKDETHTTFLNGKSTILILIFALHRYDIYDSGVVQDCRE